MEYCDAFHNIEENEEVYSNCMKDTISDHFNDFKPVDKEV